MDTFVSVPMPVWNLAVPDRAMPAALTPVVVIVAPFCASIVPAAAVMAVPPVVETLRASRNSMAPLLLMPTPKPTGEVTAMDTVPRNTLVAAVPVLRNASAPTVVMEVRPPTSMCPPAFCTAAAPVPRVAVKFPSTSSLERSPAALLPA
ncbi:hypothetical protein [Xenophilus sp. Marseille-Q4582]|uniref:hypothetical protein n=1 Tax=Xenophilus sp. Marseille-Q4582 TaxID=2866600 RepID=UPI001CE48C79|nr:hypothetical protein [Xenophilus sp. Marseille-Q4582]